MQLNERQVRFLRARAHSLKPVVTVGGAGLSEGLLRELDLSLAHHELIKVKVAAEDREQRRDLIRQLCETSGARLVQAIGHVAVLYRQAEKPVIQLPR